MDEPSRHRWIAAHVLSCEAQLRAWLSRRLGTISASDVDDFVQEAFTRIWAADLSTIRNGRAYLYATVRHLLAEYLRHHRILSIESLEEIDLPGHVSDELGPDRRVSAQQEIERLRSIVAALPLQCRRVFEMRKFQGLSHREIAQRMGLSEKTVENYVTRALTRIAAVLANVGPNEVTGTSGPSNRRVRHTDRGTG